MIRGKEYNDFSRRLVLDGSSYHYLGRDTKDPLVFFVKSGFTTIIRIDEYDKSALLLKKQDSDQD